MGAAEKGANDGVKAAALVGLERHVRLLSPGWNDTNRDGLATKLLAMTQAPKSPSQSEEAYAYLTARCLQILDLFKHSKTEEVSKFAMDVLANEFTHPILREQALATVGRVDTSKIPEATKIAAGRYTLRYMKKRLEEWQDINDMTTSAGAGGSGGSGGYGGAGGAYGSGYGDSGGMAAGYGGGGSGYGAPQQEEKKVKENPFDKQDRQVVFLRRFMHDLAQNIRLGVSGEMRGDVPAEVKKGILAGIPDGDESMMLMHAVRTLQEVQVALNKETIQQRSDLNTEILPLITKLIATAEKYPGAVIKRTSQSSKKHLLQQRQKSQLLLLRKIRLSV